VTVPVGPCWLPTVAVFETAVPSGPPAEGWEKTMGMNLRMLMVKVWQAGAWTPLLAHTVVGPKLPAAVGTPNTLPWASMMTPGGTWPAVTAYVGAGENALLVNW
jgi:hypothetical protein